MEAGARATNAPPEAVGIEDVERAAQALVGLVRETPLLPAAELSRRAGTKVTLKAECLQLTGSFKLRGASYRMSLLSRTELHAGVVAASAGNHAQGVALAARRLGARADLFMPADAPLAKLTAVREHGGEVRLVDGAYEEAAEAARQFAEREGKLLIHPFDDPAIVAGQGTAGLEVAGQAPATRLVVVPLGGGALAAGVAIALKARLPGSRVVGVQAEARTGKTICDGIAIKRPGGITLPLVERHLDGIVTVSDDETAQAMVLLLDRSKLVVEGAGAVGVAALLQGRIEPPPDAETCVVLSGGNVDASRLAECIRLGETAAGRRMVLYTVVPDRPGALASLLRIVAEEDANVVDVVHLREGVELHVTQTAVRLVLQTNGRDHSESILEAVRAQGFDARLEH